MLISVERNDICNLRKQYPREIYLELIDLYHWMCEESAENVFDGHIPKCYMSQFHPGWETFVPYLVDQGLVVDEPDHVFVKAYRSINRQCTRAGKIKNTEAIRNTRQRKKDLVKAAKKGARQRQTLSSQSGNLLTQSIRRGVKEMWEDYNDETTDDLIDKKWSGKTLSLCLALAAETRNESKTANHIDIEMFFIHQNKIVELANDIKKKHPINFQSLTKLWINDLRSGKTKFADYLPAMCEYDWFANFHDKRRK